MARPTKNTFSGTPPKEAIRYFRAKGVKPGFSYRDVWRVEHAYAWTVAKAMTMDVLGSIRVEVDSALAIGRTFASFKKDLTPTLQKLGWWGEKEMIDPVTGEPKMVQLGSPHRLKTIYDTNMRTARAAGQWGRIQRTKRSHPYLVYGLGPSRVHRPEHVAWAGTILPADDPWWDTHFTPNGWGCKCFTRQVSGREAERLGGVTARPSSRRIEWINERTGEVSKVPIGIDPGWDYNPGKERFKALEERETGPRKKV